jgi:hypothetical protein
MNDVAASSTPANAAVYPGSYQDGAVARQLNMRQETYNSVFQTVVSCQWSHSMAFPPSTSRSMTRSAGGPDYGGADDYAGDGRRNVHFVLLPNLNYIVCIPHLSAVLAGNYSNTRPLYLSGTADLCFARRCLLYARAFLCILGAIRVSGRSRDSASAHHTFHTRLT